MAILPGPCHVLLLGHDPDVTDELRALFAGELGCLVTDLAVSSDSPRFIKASDAPHLILVGVEVPYGDPRFADTLGVSLTPTHQERRIFVGFSMHPERLEPGLRHRLAELRIAVMTTPANLHDLPSMVQHLELRLKESLGGASGEVGSAIGPFPPPSPRPLDL